MLGLDTVAVNDLDVDWRVSVVFADGCRCTSIGDESGRSSVDDVSCWGMLGIHVRLAALLMSSGDSVVLVG